MERAGLRVGGAGDDSFHWRGRRHQAGLPIGSDLRDGVCGGDNLLAAIHAGDGVADPGLVVTGDLPGGVPCPLGVVLPADIAGDFGGHAESTVDATHLVDYGHGRDVGFI